MGRTNGQSHGLLIAAAAGLLRVGHNLRLPGNAVGLCMIAAVLLPYGYILCFTHGLHNGVEPCFKFLLLYAASLNCSLPLHFVASWLRVLIT
ncbi:hypothetical protein Dimus_015399 [Dionaea muscipula]